MAKFTRPIFLGTPARLPQAPAPQTGEGGSRSDRVPEPAAPSVPDSGESSWTGDPSRGGARQLDRIQQGMKDLQRGLRGLARPRSRPDGAPASSPPQVKGGAPGGAATAKGKGGSAASPQAQARGGAGAAAGRAGAGARSESPADPAARGKQGSENRPGSDSFGAQAAARKLAKPSLMPPPGPVMASTSQSGVLYALNQAQEPGVYYREHPRDEGQTEDDEDPELAAAVEEAIRLLFGVRGIHHIGPGQNQAGEPVIVIAAGRGFGAASLAAIPEKVHRFKTLVALPYELLPLRQER